MKKKLLLLPLAGILIYALICSYAAGPGVTGGIDGTGASNPNGCNCHGAAAASTTVAIELDTIGGAVRTQYIAGGHYLIKITGTNTSATATLPYFGFQVTAINVTGAGTTSATNVGTLATTGLPASCQFTPSGTYGGMALPVNVVEHSAPIIATTGTGGSGSTYVESIGWTAPAAGTGTIKLYGVVNAVNHDGGDDGDAWNNDNISVTEFTPSAITPITGTFTTCVGASTMLADAASGTWSGTTSVAFVTPTGKVVGLTGGTVVVSYTETAGVATATVTVTPRPAASSISGPNAVCQNGSINLTDDTTGGTWSSVYAGIATVNSISGAVTGLSAGIDTITYAVTNACGTADSNYVVTVEPLTSAGTIMGGTSVCEGATLPLSSTVGGGTWSSSNAAIATVSSGGGIVSGIAVGNDTITYSVTGTCGTADSTLAITVNIAADPGVLTGASTVCEGDTVRFTDTTSGGVWTSSNATVASVNSSGVVTGVSGDTASAVIFYTVTNGCGPVSAFAPVTVDPLPLVGTITGVSTLCPGAIDTLTDTVSGGAWSSANTTGFVTSGGVVIPLSGISGLDTISYSATNACGTSAATFVINITGSKAGTIMGDATVCIGHETILIDTISGGVWSQNNDSFGIISPTTGLFVATAAGPDTIFYSFSTSCGTASSYYVVQVSDCWPAAVNNVATGEFKVYPNPASGMLTIEMPQSNSNTTVTVTDLMGKVVMTQPAGNTQTADLDLSRIPAGNYLLKVTSGDNTYREKITVTQ